MGAIAKYFIYNRTIASGIAFSGGSLGMIVFPFLFQACLEAFTLRGVFLVYAGLMLNFVVVGLLMGAIEHQPNIEFDNHAERESHEMRKTDIPETNTDTNIQAERQSVSTSIKDDKNLTKFQTCIQFWRPFFRMQFIIFSIYFFAYIYGMYGFLFYIPSYLVELGLSKSQVASAMSISGILDLISRLVIGFIARWPRVNTHILIAVNTAIVGCSDILVPLMLTSGSAYAVMVGNLALVGLFTGGLLGLINQLIVDAVGTDRAGTGTGISGAIFGITILIFSQVYGR